jgi:iron complex outermembrane receptor protein
MSKDILCRVLLTGVCSLALAAPAFAQDQTAPAPDTTPAETDAPQTNAPAAPAEADAGEEIIVTAQNRSQNVQDVPITMDVIGGEELKNAGFANMNDVGKIAPVVQVNQDQGTVKITVRGVGTASNDEAQDTSVVVNVDGEYINRPDALSVALFDMERVEVLRGPQGTLYGRNSTGGAVNFITRKPGRDTALNASVSYGNYDAVRVDTGVDITFGDIGGVRFSGFYDKHDGYVKHPPRSAFGPFPAFDGGRSDDNESFGGRANVKLTPTDALTINIAAEYAEREFTPQAFAFVDLNAAGNAPAPTATSCNVPGYTQVAPEFASAPNFLLLCSPSETNFLSTIDRSEYSAPGFGLGKITQSTYALRGRAAYEFSRDATLTYTVGYRSFSGEPGFITLPVAYRSFNFINESDAQSHELRLNGDIGGIVYQVGGFYFKENQLVEEGFFLPIGPNGTFLSYFRRDISSDSKSAFGQVEVPIMETLTAVGGLRYTKNKRDAIYTNAAPFGAGPPDPGLFNAGPGRKDFDDLAFVSELPLDSSEDKITWLVGLNYKPNNDTLVYAKASTGFKGGGFDSVGVYKPETNTAYEAGAKLNFGPRGRSIFNTSAFYYDYKDLQVAVLLDTNVGGQIFNAGAATIWGLEATVDHELDRNNILHGSVNYLHAKYDELLAQFNVFCIDQNTADTIGCVNGVGDLDPNTAGVQQPDFAGNRPPFSPRWIITAGYDHIFELGGAGTVTASVNTTYKSSYFTDFFNNSDGKQKGIHQTDLSLEWKDDRGRFGVQAFVKNIENKRPLTYGSFVSAGPDDIFNWQFGSPRLYGVRLSFDY